MTTSQRNKLRIAAVVLLLYLPAFVGVAWTYAYFSPRQFSAAGEFVVRWGLMNGAEFQQALKDVAWNNRSFRVEFESLDSFDRSGDYLSYLGPGKGTVTRFRISALAERPEDAHNIVATLMVQLEERINKQYFRQLGEYVPISAWYTPINLTEKPKVPFEPAHPNVFHAMLIGTVVGLAFAAIGLLLMWYVLRVDASERANA